MKPKFRVQYRLLPDGGFVAGDLDTRITGYAYPSSLRAEQAKQDPAGAAQSMIGLESSWKGRALSPAVPEFDRRNWKLLQEEKHHV